MHGMSFEASEAYERLNRGTATLEGLSKLKLVDLKALYEHFKPRSAQHRPKGLSTKSDYAEWLLTRMPEPRKPGRMDDTDALNAVDPFTRNVWTKVMGKLDAGEATEAFKQFECAFAAAYQLGYQLGWAEASAKKAKEEPCE